MDGLAQFMRLGTKCFKSSYSSTHGQPQEIMLGDFFSVVGALSSTYGIPVSGAMV